MAVNSSGILTLSGLQTEFGGTSPISLSEYYRGGTYTTANNTVVPTSGLISISKFYGSVKQFTVTIATDMITTGVNLRTLAVTAGWNQSDKLVVIVNSGVVVRSTSNPTVAIYVAGSFPNGVTLVNNGSIIGCGGAGGISTGGYTIGNAGQNGGAAIYVESTYITIENNGTIAGGGGGGGSSSYAGYSGTAGPGGGGGAGFGASGGYGNRTFFNLTGYRLTTAGTLLAGGLGGWYVDERGGDGGGLGAAGASGNANGDYGSAAGGAAGYVVIGNNYVTWAATGTRYGLYV